MKFRLQQESMKTELDYGELTISGDEDHGFRPFQLLVSSIASCSGIVFQKILEKQRIDFEDLVISTHVERNPDIANRVEKISLHFVVKGSNLNEDKLNRSLGIARKNCAMIRSVEDSIEIEETLETIQL